MHAVRVEPTVPPDGESWPDLWQLQLGEAACVMTDDEVEAALERSDIDEHTLVRKPGTRAWTTLGEATGQHSLQRPRARGFYRTLARAVAESRAKP